MSELNPKNVGIALMAYSRPDHLREVLEGRSLLYDNAANPFHATTGCREITG